jgi:hypothetical protein
MGRASAIKCDHRPKKAAAKDLFLHLADESTLIMEHPSAMSSGMSEATNKRPGGAPLQLRRRQLIVQNSIGSSIPLLPHALEMMAGKGH